MEKYEWLNKKTPRSVDQLKLWSENPRLNPEETHIRLSDFAEDMTSEDSDKKHFFKLIKSIVENGFIPADPIVIWKENEKFFVAEGNRRVLALKLLRDPSKAPKSIRSFIRSQAYRINKSFIKKILVNVAPSFKDAEWYINQRNSTSSLQQPWSRVQQQRWIAELYAKYNGNVDEIEAITQMTKSELESFIRILKIKDLVELPEIKESLSADEYQVATSYRFPITILERFFSKQEVKTKWGIDFDGTDILLKNRKDFLSAYAVLIKNIVSKNPEIKIDTRTITSDFESIFKKLPLVNLEGATSSKLPLHEKFKNNSEKSVQDTSQTPIPIISPPIVKNDPNRSRLILPIYTLNSPSYRLNGLFNELKKIPLAYNNSVAASIRVFLDLAVLNYIQTDNLSGDLCAKYKTDLKRISLSERLEFIKVKLKKEKSKSTITKILNPSNELSLDVLNGYVHSDNSCFLTSNLLTRFWDLLFPLFEELLDIKES
ncbi:MAG: hypothetical protein LBU92_05930 [Prevotellaceae bacterium]|jgi:hypothetical protein|nr:hypothetical protein [Prevotellaceae bacterium]